MQVSIDQLVGRAFPVECDDYFAANHLGEVVQAASAAPDECAGNPGVGATAGDVAQQNNQLRSRVQSALFQALIEGADVEDYRGKFY